MQKRNHSFLLLAVIIMLAGAFLRMHRLVEVPPGIAYDEAQTVWDSVRVSEYGWFPSYNDTRAEPLNRYLQGMLMLVGGRTILTARLLMVFNGMLSIALTYRVIMSLLADHPYRRQAALFGMATMAVMVNAMTLSRIGDRGIFLTTISAAAVHFLALAWRTNRPWPFIWAGFFSFGAIHTYTSGIFFQVAVGLLLIHQLIFNFPAFRERLRHLPYLLVGGLPALAWWGWQFALPGPLYYRVKAVGFWEDNPLLLFTELPLRIARSMQGFFLFGDCDPQFNMFSKPLFNPVLAVLMAVGIILSLRSLRRFQSGLLLITLPVMLLPLALTVDVVHGMRNAGVFITAITLAAWGFAALWQQAKRVTWGTIAAGIGAVALFSGMAVDSFTSYFTYLTNPPEDITCDGSPMDPYFYYLNAHVELANVLNNVTVPTYVPLVEMDFPAISLIVSQNFPEIRSISAYMEPGDSLPDGQVILLQGQEDSGHYVLLMPGSRPGQGQIIILPALPADQREALEQHLLTDAEELYSPREQIGKQLPVNADFNPFHSITTPDPQLIATYDNGMRLVGVDTPFIIQPGEAADVTLYWEKGGRLPTDYYSGVTLVDAQGNGIANHYLWIMRWLYPTASWHPDDIVPDGHRLDIPPDLPPGVYRLRVSIADTWEDPQPLDAVDPNGEPIGDYFLLNYLKIPYPEPAPMPDQAEPTDIQIGEMTLSGYLVEREGQPVALSEVEPGDTITFTFYWDIKERLTGVYHLFIQAQQDAEGDVLAGWDGPPLGEAYPTIVWGPDERIVSTHTITLPPEDDLAFRVGFYEWPSLNRLPVEQDGAVMPDNRAILSE